MRPLQADAILACLEQNGVRYVLIGGLAAILHGSPNILSPGPREFTNQIT